MAFATMLRPDEEVVVRTRLDRLVRATDTDEASAVRWALRFGLEELERRHAARLEALG